MKLYNKNLKGINWSTSILISSMVLFMSCDSTPRESVKETAVEVMNSKENYVNSEEKFKEEMESYRIETLDKVAINDKKLVEFKEKAAKDKSIATKEFNRRMTELEEKNTALKSRLNAFEAGDKKNWEEFKAKCSAEALSLHGDICNVCGPQK